MVKPRILACLSAVSACAAALVASCGPNASNDTYERTTHACLPGVCPKGIADASSDGAVGNTPLEPWPDQSAGLLSGVYALHAVETAQILSLNLSLQLLYRLRILQSTDGAGTAVMQSTTLCALKLPNVPKIATRAP